MWLVSVNLHITERFRNIVILCIYLQLSDSDITIIDSLSGFRAAYQPPMIIMGDFNVHHQDWLSSTHM